MAMKQKNPREKKIEGENQRIQRKKKGSHGEREREREREREIEKHFSRQRGMVIDWKELRSLAYHGSCRRRNRRRRRKI